MTPFGKRLRQIRAERGISQKEMAKAVGVSAAYLSALEHGHRGLPSWALLQRIIAYLNVIWDDADELQRLALRSSPRVVIDTSGLDPRATELANLLAVSIGDLGRDDLDHLIRRLQALSDQTARSVRGPSSAEK
ncbi:helix-turn-helix domain-containing protein [Oricola cellulosilytica]|uniref:XRE family transcriptional regulator n=1 Tax=Oricola cellulosilytica TaxID=1429082 RepID=A0A4R0PDY3_9HYPH|nr:helix-turn-helix transcriptional regulator [Oricola cellulosilytica]TCD15996.1 XRE family transcriptional regulator [Oricola cellulosilytica]